MSVVVPVPPAERVTLVALRVVVGPDGDMEDVRVMVPVKPLMLVRVMVDAADDPAWIVRLPGLAAMVKSGAGALVLKVAVWTVSGTGVGVPLARVTHVLGGTLVLAQPVWNPRGIPDVGLVTL